MPSPSSSEYRMWLSPDECDFPAPLFLCKSIPTHQRAAHKQAQGYLSPERMLHASAGIMVLMKEFVELSMTEVATLRIMAARRVLAGLLRTRKRM